MRVGVDASNLRLGGGLTHLVALLGAANPGAHGFDQMVVWGSRSTLSKIKNRDWLIKVHDSLLDRGLLYRVFWQRFRLKMLAQKVGCDVLFVPGGSDASGFKPLVTMSRNLLPFEWREMRRYGFSWRTLKNVLLKIRQTSTFRGADGLIFLTKYAQDVVMESVGKTRGKVSIISHGIDKRFFCEPRIQHEIKEFTTESPLRLLYVSIVDVYKHQWHVVEAVAELRIAGLPVVLDLVGPPASGLRRLKNTLERLDPCSQFAFYHGLVPYEKLHEFYVSANIGVFASSCENMPNIVLEGMASGLPIASSNRGPMPEVLGDAGVYFDPEQPNEIAEAIRTLIESPALRMEKAHMAFQRAQKFSWVRCADETFGFLGQVLNVWKGGSEHLGS